jgi:hypothetical protein
VRAGAISFSKISGVISVVWNWVNRADLGAGDAEFLVRGHGHEGAGFRLDAEGLVDAVLRGLALLGDDAGALDQFDKRRGAAVADGRLVGVHLDDGVIDAEAGQRGEDMLDGLHLYVALGDGGGALDGFDVLDAGVDGRLVGEIAPAEFAARARRGGVQGEGDLLPGVESGAREGGAFGEGLLGEKFGHQAGNGSGTSSPSPRLGLSTLHSQSLLICAHLAATAGTTACHSPAMALWDEPAALPS